MKKINFNFSSINLWCNKNLVDLQYFLWRIFNLWQLETNYNINYFADPFESNVDIVFLNSCWFLESARIELLENVKSLLENWKKVYILWCWVQYFKNLDNENIPKLLKNKNLNFLWWNDLETISILDIKNWFSSKKFEDFKMSWWIRVFTNQPFWFEYLKIAEWCNNNCSFCIIPKIRWKQKSKTIETILDEFKTMLDNQIKEIIILAQDTTRYWIDLYKKTKLFELLENIEKIDWNFKYRLMYLYPDLLSFDLIKKLQGFKKFIPYFDIPIQHISKNVLKNMNRFWDSQKIKWLLSFIRQEFQNSFIRTNIIVWFPWESDEDFFELKEFLSEFDFDNISIFEYHDEKLASSSKLENKIDDSIIKKRFDILKKIVDKKIEKNNKKLIQNWISWYIMDITWKKQKTYIVRPWICAPEIDPYFEVVAQNLNNNKLQVWDYIEFDWDLM